MDTNYQDLPPLKRFRLIEQQKELQNQQPQHNQKSHDEGVGISCSTLPPKKRKEYRDSTFLSHSPFSVSVNTYPLPVKKRVWALQPDFASNAGVSSMDLDVEYKPSIEEEVKSVDDEHIDPEIPLLENCPAVGNGIENIEDVDEDGIVCAVCQSTDGDPSDPIVLCDGDQI